MACCSRPPAHLFSQLTPTALRCRCHRCGHCKRMVGEYKTLGELVQSDPALKNRVVVAKVGGGWGAL